MGADLDLEEYNMGITIDGRRAPRFVKMAFHVLPEAVESCDFKTLKIEIGHIQPKK